MLTMLDRKAARRLTDEYVGAWMDHGSDTERQFLDALEGCVRPAPPQTIDRDALAEMFDNDPAWLADERDPSHEGSLRMADRILALLQSIEILKWQVVGSDGFVYAQFVYSVDALEYKAHAPEDVRGHLNIEKIGE